MKYIDKDGNETQLQENQTMFIRPDGTIKVLGVDEFLIPFIVKTEDLEDIINAHCHDGGYLQFIHNEDKSTFIENPVTPEQFAWRRVRDFAINPLINDDLKAKKAEKLADITPREIIVKGS